VLLDLRPANPAPALQAFVLPKRHHLAPPEPSASPTLLHGGGLSDEQHPAVRGLQDEKWRFRELGPGRARHAPAQRHSRLQAHQLARRRGIRDPEIAAPEALLDVSQNLHLAERGPVVERQAPGLGARPRRQPQPLQELEPADQLEPERSRPAGSRDRIIKRDEPPGPHALLQDGIELAETLHLDSSLTSSHAIRFGAVAERLGRQLAASQPDAVLHVLPVQQQRPAGLVPATKGHVDMRVVGVVVVDRDPLEPRPEIPLHGIQDAPSVVHQVESLAALGRQDHLPHARIFGLLPAVEPPVDLHRTLRSVEAEPLVTLPLSTFASQVAAMGAPAPGRLVGHVLELDDAPLLARRRAEPRVTERPALGTCTSLAMPNACRDLAEEKPAAFAALDADAPQTDAPRAFRGFVSVALHATVPSVRSRRRASMRPT